MLGMERAGQDTEPDATNLTPAAESMCPGREGGREAGRQLSEAALQHPRLPSSRGG